jgi:hypothetical protein
VEAVANCGCVLEMHPGDINAEMLPADLLATCSDPEVRDGKRAIELATRAAAELRKT